MLQPKTDWYWYSQQDALGISLGKDMAFLTAFKPTNLVNVPDKPQLFNLQDSENYLRLADKLQNSDLSRSPAQLTQIALNACAALAFHKPLSSKSWYFTQQVTHGACNSLSFLENQYGKGIVLAISTEHGAVTCMLLSESLRLSEHKSMREFQLIKVMENRLIPYIAESVNLQRA
jgi:cell division protein ZapC